MQQNRFWKYENRLLLILARSFGFAFFDRNADSYLSTYLAAPISQGGLDLNNKQLGTLGSVLALSWALSGLAIGRWSDAARRRKPFLIAILIVFSACSVLSGLSNSFSSLFVSNGADCTGKKMRAEKTYFR